MNVKSLEERLEKLNLKRSINNLSKRLERFDPSTNDSKHWKGKEIIPLVEWLIFKGTDYELKCFPEDFIGFGHLNQKMN